MPATIVVEGGSGPGREFPVEEEVFRVGSGPACRLQLPAPVEPHAATVEYRNGGYVVYNKGARPLQVEGRSVAAPGFAPWAAGQRLQLAPGVVLRLNVEGDPAPAKRLRPAVDVAKLGTDVAPEAADEKAPPKKRSKTLQWIVVGVCALAVPIMLVYNPNPDAGPSADSQEEFATLVKDLRDKEPEPQAGPNALWSLLESARAAELRGDGETAQRQYSRILMLLRQRKAGSGELPELDKKVWKFVGRRIRQ